MQSAHEISTTTMKDRMEDLTGGFKLNLPGMGDEVFDRNVLSGQVLLFKFALKIDIFR
jgi:hypothetical protein